MNKPGTTLVNISNREQVLKISGKAYISMSFDIHSELLAYVQHYTTEVSGCGMIEVKKNVIAGKYLREPDVVQMEYKITEVYLPERQSNTGGSTDIEEDMVSELIAKLVSEGKETGNMLLHWHSHADMNTFHSSIDNDNYNTLRFGDYLVSLVINRAGDFLGRVDYYNPFRVSIIGVPIYSEMPISSVVSARASENIAKLDKHIADTSRYVVNNWRNAGYNSENYSAWNYQKAGEHNRYGFYDSTGQWHAFFRYRAVYRSNLYNGFDDIESEDNKGGNDDRFDIARRRQEKKKLRESLGVSKKQAHRFETCDTTKCYDCDSTQKCTQYVYELQEIERT